VKINISSNSETLCEATSRFRGKPKMKLEDEVTQDIQTMKIKNRRIAKNISRWDDTVEQTRAHRGLWSLTRR
jgi:hypothetical protein